jgi:hypothetical protein
MVDRSEAQRTLRTINGRSRLHFDKTKLVPIQDRLSDLNSNILQNEEGIAGMATDLQENYIPQPKKADLIIPPWVDRLQSDVKISGFDLDVRIQGPPGVAPEDLGCLQPIPLTSALKRGFQ